ncbi:DUF1269 domain-containing protein [Streptomyces albus subsp. chlorinus]|uniref:DUF1269 domain-containing protein n=1 Tax=Streptomyces albus TaxID=1888 RepID=UPI00156DB182|nr:DUF1269 domain-containing protein [Streptomyces albus]NSC22209.1 DUF1269 domain-containing protein [Streptomyces albus subsp. chlorinus]
MTENIVFADFTGRGTRAALQALDGLEDAHRAGTLRLREARVIGRDADGNAEIVGEVDNIGSATGFAVGGLIGALVGLVGGPAGALVGFGAGGLIGGSHDARRVIETNEGLEELTAEIPPGSTVVVADVEEESSEPVDEAMGPGVSRYLASRVRRDLEETLSTPQTPPNPSDAPTGPVTAHGHEVGPHGEGEKERASGREEHWWRR